mgnify:CR=1 FL=1
MPVNDAGSTRPTFMKRLIASGALRFAGWWSIFAGALALNSVCPICGGASCPVGIGTTGVIAAVLAGTKQWGGAIIRYVRGFFGSSKAAGEQSAAACACQGPGHHEHNHHSH